MVFKRSILPLLIASALTGGNAYAQDEEQKCEELEGTPPGLYTTTDEGATFLIQGDQIVEMQAGQAGFADENRIMCIKRIPKFMDWPCSTDAAQSRKFSTYSIDDLDPNSRPQEIVRRYFEVPEVIEPLPNWKDGEYHLIMSMNEIAQFNSPEYWYHPDLGKPILHEKRPTSLQIALFVGLNKAVVDSYTLAALEELHGSDAIPVTFVFNDSNVVPISYFGPNVSLEEILKANKERAIKIADVPMWELGDYHLEPSVAEFLKYFDIPDVTQIPADRRQKLENDLTEHGFSRKPVFVTMLTGPGTLALDQPERVAVAISMGITEIPTLVVTIEEDSFIAACGPGTPLGLDGGAISGDTTPPGGVVLPPGSTVPPPIDPEPEPPVSDG